LDYPSILITSSNDPYISVEEPHSSGKMGSSFINIGERASKFESQLEYWEEGQEILQSLVHMIEEKIVSGL
jgi:predicted alpha/beta hydrolase family esterase